MLLRVFQQQQTTSKGSECLNKSVLNMTYIHQFLMFVYIETANVMHMARDITSVSSIQPVQLFCM